MSDGNMPFHGHHHSIPSNAPPNAASGLFQAGQALGSVGAPAGSLRIGNPTTPAGSDVLLPTAGNSGDLTRSAHNGGQTAPPSTSSLAGPPESLPSNSNAGSSFDTPRRTNTFAEELHLSSGPQHMDPSSQQGPYTPNTSTAPNINLQQATPQGAQFHIPSQSNLPNTLQPGNPGGRPGPSSAYTAPSTVPTMPQSGGSSQQLGGLSRAGTTSASHSYSRSSPAGLEQKYASYSVDQGKHSGTPTQKYYSPQTPLGPSSYSPLALADIRPRANSHLDEGSLGASNMFDERADILPSNSNYVAPWPIYAFDWCKWPVHGGQGAGKIALGSFLEDPHNFIQILDTQIAPQEIQTPGAPGYGLEYVKIAEATCSYPVTRILWEPPSSQKQSTDLLATSGDHLRLWSLPAQTGPNISSTITRSSSVNQREQPVQKLTPLALLSNSKTPEHTAPLTSLDWNTVSPKLIITSSIDTTCTIWDIPTLTAKTQLIAHDKEVFDVRFCAGSTDVFVSCGADGSVRMFDLRSLDHSTIIYEPSEKGDKNQPASPAPQTPQSQQHMLTPSPPLLRVSASPHDSHLLATFAADSNIIRILDVRQPGTALLELRGHAAAINCIEWAPSRRGMLTSGADDCQVLVWDLLSANNTASTGQNGSAGQVLTAHGGLAPAAPGAGENFKGPSASWRCDFEVGNLSWAPQSSLTAQGGEWVGVVGGRGIWSVKL